MRLGVLGDYCTSWVVAFHLGAWPGEVSALHPRAALAARLLSPVGLHRVRRPGPAREEPVWL